MNASPLVMACSKGLLEAGRGLVESNADVNDEIPLTGDTPLHFAAHSGNCELIEYLLEQMADPSKSNFRGQTPMIFAAHENNKNAVSLIASYVADKQQAMIMERKISTSPELKPLDEENPNKWPGLAKIRKSAIMVQK